MTDKTKLKNARAVTMAGASLKKALAAFAAGRKLTTRQLADALGYSYVYTYTLIRGDGKVSADVLVRVVRAFGGDAGGELLRLAGMPKVTGVELVNLEGTPIPVATIGRAA